MNTLHAKRTVTQSVVTVLAMLAFAAPIWAQTVSADPKNKRVATSNGCALTNWRQDVSSTILRAEGRCVNGLAEGEWVYSVRDIFPNGDAVDSVFVGWFRAGYASGLTGRFTKDGARIRSDDPSAPGPHYTSGILGNAGEAVELSTIHQKIDEAVAVSRGKNLPISQAATTKSLAKQWLDDRQGLHAKWVVPSSSAQSNQAGSSPDDPKTTGRGARGG